jgi:hypothetical protein
MDFGRVVGMGVLAASLAAACGPSSTKTNEQTGGSGGSSNASGGTAGTGNSGGDSVTQFRGVEYAAICRALFACMPRNDDEISIQAVLGSAERCLDIISKARSPSVDLADLNASVEAGTVLFHPEKVTGCTNALGQCGTLQSLAGLDTAACRAVFEGTVPAGGACRRDEECANDGVCRGDATCPGQCVPRAPVGAACEYTNECDDTSGPVICDYGTQGTGGLCHTVTVHATVGEGQACNRDVDDKLGLTPCAAGLWCDTSASTSVGGAAPEGTCRKPLAAGSPCTSTSAVCQFGYWCFDEVSCKPWSLVQKAGGNCAKDTGPYCDPTYRLSCVDNVCTSIGDGHEGSDCSVGDEIEWLTCDSDLTCYASTDATGQVVSARCEAPHAAGQPCQKGGDCASGTCQPDDTCAPAYCSLKR